jgi:hypothetical protein
VVVFRPFPEGPAVAQPYGRRLAVSLPRRFVADLVRAAGRVPLCTTERLFRLADVVDARSAAEPRPGWAAVFTRAYALVAVRRAELRRAYIPWPWPHLYEHPESVASVAVERRYRDEDAVFFTQVRGPENQTLAAIDGHLRRCKEEPVESIALFRRALFTSRLPLPLRRLLWWFGTSTCGHRKARYLGTFGVSVTSGMGAAGLNLLTPVTTGLNYGLFAADGALPVRLTYDHRVLDGAAAARALTELEAVLKESILLELRDMQGDVPPPGAGDVAAKLRFAEPADWKSAATGFQRR